MRTFREAILTYIEDRKLCNSSDSLRAFILFNIVLQCYFYDTSIATEYRIRDVC